SAQAPSRLTWLISGYIDHQQPIDSVQLNSRPLSLELQAENAREPNVMFHCQNMESGEQATVPVDAQAIRQTAAGWQLQIRLDAVWLDLPYPVDPGAVESKPMAIISQRTGVSVL